MAITEISVSKIYVLATEPTNKVKDRFWFDTTNNLLKRYDGTYWKPISVSSDDVVVLSSGSKVSLTNYLNTQIAALAEGIDSKQDKLKFYSEIDKSGDASTDSTGSEINLKTSASQYGGSNINLTAENGQYKPGNINLKSKSCNTSAGGNITLESEGGSTSGGNIILHSKSNLGEGAESGGKISLIADGNEFIESNIELKANNVELNVEDKYYQRSSISVGYGRVDLSSDTAIYLDSEDIGGSCIDKNFNSSTSTYLESKLPSTKFVNDLVDYKVTNLSSDISTSLNGKQDQLIFYHEETSNREASILGADSFSIQNTNQGLILNGNNGGITITNSSFNTGQGVISIGSNNWEDGSDPILFDVDGQVIKISDALLISEIKNKQNSTDETLNTIDKTIVGAINELLASINTNVITSTEQKRITTTSTSAGIQMSTTAKTCMVSINPVKTNVGAIYISTSSDTAPTINPLYPDQMPKYKFPDASQVYIWSDVNGDSVDLTIEYYG